MGSFKPIINKLRKFTFNSAALHILNILKQQESQTSPTPFWYSLLLLRWTLEYSEVNYPYKEASKDDIIKILESFDEVDIRHPILDSKSEEKDIEKILTIYSQQQIWYQSRVDIASFYRQYLLFIKLKHKNDITKSFHKSSGIELNTFLKACFVIFSVTSHGKLLNKHKTLYLKDSIDFIENNFGKDVRDNLTSLFSISKDSFKTFINSDKRKIDKKENRYDLQFFELSIFTRKPFLNIDNSLIIPHKKILNYTFNYFIYDFLKSNDEYFTTEFGYRLEKYVAKGLDELNLKYKTENDLKKELGLHKNLVDFVVNKTIFIEVKAIELNPKLAVEPRNRTLANGLKTSIVKAYFKQILQVAKSLKSDNEEYFGIIITYKNLFLGNSTRLWNQFLSKEIDKLISEKVLQLEDLNIVPIENIFLIDIQTWDLLIQILKSNPQFKLQDILKKVRETDKNPTDQKFTFEMHLDDYERGKLNLNYLTDVGEDFLKQ